MRDDVKAAASMSATWERTRDGALAAYMSEVASRMEPVHDPAADSGDQSLILTDDHAPVELLGMRAIDNIIAEQAGPYRDILKKEGIGGLLHEVG